MSYGDQATSTDTCGGTGQQQGDVLSWAQLCSATLHRNHACVLLLRIAAQDDMAYVNPLALMRTLSCECPVSMTVQHPGGGGPRVVQDRMRCLARQRCITKHAQWSPAAQVSCAARQLSPVSTLRTAVPGHCQAPSPSLGQS